MTLPSSKSSLEKSLQQNLIDNLYEEENKNSKLEKELSSLKKELAGLRRSFSWKITLPLRALFLGLRKSVTFIQLLYFNVKNEKGMISFLSLAFYQIKKNGFSHFFCCFKKRHLLADEDYFYWVKTFDTLDEAKIEHIKADQDSFEIRPLLSVIILVDHPNSEYFKACIQSVQDQIYPHWEVCLVGNTFLDGDIKNIINEYIENDARFTVIFHAEKRTTYEAINSGIDLSRGEYIAFLDQNDGLAKEAFYWVAKNINRYAQLAIFYSDEDKIDAQGNRHNPHFKPDYNPELLFGYNYVKHLMVIKKSLLQQVNGLRMGFEGAEDYDLMLRCLEEITPDQIIHCTEILYHQRSDEKNAIISADDQKSSTIAGEKALREYFEKQNINATTQFNPKLNAYETHFYPTKQPLISIIIPTKDAYYLVLKCIESIYEKTNYKNFEIILIDNNSSDPISLQIFAQLAEKYCNLTLVHDVTTPFNYSKINNSAAKLVQGEYLLFLNNDIEVISPNWINEMLGIAQYSKSIGAVGAKLYYADDTIQHAGVILGLEILQKYIAGHAFNRLPKEVVGYMARTHLIQAYSAVTAACLLVSKENFDSVGGFNEGDLAVAFNDLDFCLKLQEKGLRNVWTPYAELYHYESISRGSDDENNEKLRRLKKESDYIINRWKTDGIKDPYYNPNFLKNNRNNNFNVRG